MGFRMYLPSNKNIGGFAFSFATDDISISAGVRVNNKKAYFCSTSKDPRHGFREFDLNDWTVFDHTKYMDRSHIVFKYIMIWSHAAAIWPSSADGPALAGISNIITHLVKRPEWQASVDKKSAPGSMLYTASNCLGYNPSNALVLNVGHRWQVAIADSEIIIWPCVTGFTLVSSTEIESSVRMSKRSVGYKCLGDIMDLILVSPGRDQTFGGCKKSKNIIDSLHLALGSKRCNRVKICSVKG